MPSDLEDVDQHLGGVPDPGDGAVGMLPAGQGEVGYGRPVSYRKGQVTWKKLASSSSVAHSTTRAERLSRM